MEGVDLPGMARVLPKWRYLQKITKTIRSKAGKRAWCGVVLWYSWGMDCECFPGVVMREACYGSALGVGRDVIGEVYELGWGSRWVEVAVAVPAGGAVVDDLDVVLVD